MEEHKVVILGSGIAGMTAGIYLKRGGLDVLVVEDNIPGGVLNEIPSIENYPGYEEISGPDLAMNIYNQLTKLGVKILNKKITSIDLNNKIINNNIKYEYLVIATGRKSRMLSLEHEKELLGKGISTCALCDGFFYKDKKVAVVGGGSSSLTEALYLSKICHHVTLIHRRDSLRASRVYEEQLKKSHIHFVWNSQVVEILADKHVTGVKVQNVVTNEMTQIDCDGLFVAIGRIPDTEIVKGQLELDKSGYIIADESTCTNIPGVFAIGDVRTKALRQIVTAASDGATCSYYIEQYLLDKE